MKAFRFTVLFCFVLIWRSQSKSTRGRGEKLFRNKFFSWLNSQYKSVWKIQTSGIAFQSSIFHKESHVLEILTVNSWVSFSYNSPDFLITCFIIIIIYWWSVRSTRLSFYSRCPFQCNLLHLSRFGIGTRSILACGPTMGPRVNNDCLQLADRMPVETMLLLAKYKGREEREGVLGGNEREGHRCSEGGHEERRILGIGWNGDRWSTVAQLKEDYIVFWSNGTCFLHGGVPQGSLVGLLPFLLDFFEQGGPSLIPSASHADAWSLPFGVTL